MVITDEDRVNVRMGSLLVIVLRSCPNTLRPALVSGVRESLLYSVHTHNDNPDSL